LLPPAERPFGKYELIAKLATGGMAHIFLAREEVDGSRKLVVIKRALPHLLKEERFVAMFEDEGRLAQQIVHPNVCRVYEAGTVGDSYFIAMEYLHGVPLSRILIRAARTKKPVDIDIVVGIVMQCAEGLHHAHELSSASGEFLGVVHRDVSPPNIVVTEAGVAKLVDFGVAKARGATQKTRTGTVKGKNSYMSPEQILGDEVDRRSDVFSLGIVLWEALAAKRLFSRDTDFQTFAAITEEEIPNLQQLRPDVNDALAAVVEKALAKRRDDRYPTTKAMGEALAEAVDIEEGIEGRIGSFVTQSFAKELASRTVLTTNITQSLAAIHPEAVTEVSDVQASARGTQRVPALSIPSRTSLAGTRNAARDTSFDWGRLIIPLAAACVVTAVAAYMLL